MAVTAGTMRGRRSGNVLNVLPSPARQVWPGRMKPAVTTTGTPGGLTQVVGTNGRDGSGAAAHRCGRRPHGNRRARHGDAVTKCGDDWDDAEGPDAGWPPGADQPRQLTLALLEDLAAVLVRHGYPPLTGYALAELTGSLYRIARTNP